MNERRSSATIVARLNQLATAGCQFAIDVRWLKISSLLEVFFSFGIVALHMSSLNRLKSYVFIHIPHMLVAFRNSHIASLIVIVKGLLIIGVQVLPSFLVDLPQTHQCFLVAFGCLFEILYCPPQILLCPIPIPETFT